MEPTKFKRTDSVYACQDSIESMASALLVLQTLIGTPSHKVVDAISIISSLTDYVTNALLTIPTTLTLNNANVQAYRDFTSSTVPVSLALQGGSTTKKSSVVTSIDPGATTMSSSSMASASV